MTTDLKVTINEDYFGPGDGVYVIEDPSGGHSAIGFDVCLERIERYAIELGMPGTPQMTRGSIHTYTVMRGMEAALSLRFEETGEQAVAGLSPQLHGLEGWRVEVVDEEGDEPRRFIVGKSTGPIPCHLEIPRRYSKGGMAARLEYHSVRAIEHVRHDQ